MRRDDLKPGKRITDTIIEALEPEPGKSHTRIALGEGLYLVITPQNTKSWQVRYKHPTRGWTTEGLGKYPLVGLALAREKAQTFLKSLRDGNQPATKQEIKAKETISKNRTFNVLMADWLSVMVNKWGKVTYDKAIKSINKHLIPTFGSRDYTTITPKEWLGFFEHLQHDLKIYNQTEKLVS